MTQIRTGDHTLVRELNLSSVLRYLHIDPPLSRAQLASLTNLNKSTISSLVEELIERGLGAITSGDRGLYIGFGRGCAGLGVRLPAHRLCL